MASQMPQENYKKEVEFKAIPTIAPNNKNSEI